MTGEVFNIGITYLCRVSFDEVVLSEDLIDSRWICNDEFENYLSSKVCDDIRKAEL
jgi:hypothetical protein